MCDNFLVKIKIITKSIFRQTKCVAKKVLWQNNLFVTRTIFFDNKWFLAKDYAFKKKKVFVEEKNVTEQVFRTKG